MSDSEGSKSIISATSPANNPPADQWRAPPFCSLHWKPVEGLAFLQPPLETRAWPWRQRLSGAPGGHKSAAAYTALAGPSTGLRPSLWIRTTHTPTHRRLPQPEFRREITQPCVFIFFGTLRRFQPPETNRSAPPLTCKNNGFFSLFL